jgi:hypothetical protein
MTYLTGCKDKGDAWLGAYQSGLYSLIMTSSPQDNAPEAKLTLGDLVGMPIDELLKSQSPALDDLTQEVVTTTTGQIWDCASLVKDGDDSDDSAE